MMMSLLMNKSTGVDKHQQGSAQRRHSELLGCQVEDLGKSEKLEAQQTIDRQWTNPTVLSPVPPLNAAAEGRNDLADGDNIDCSLTGGAMPSAVELPRCDKCGKMFARESTLLTHLRTHDGDMPYQCDVCQARFADWSTELIPHLRMHGSSTNAYPCHVCGEEYVSRSCLKKHLRSHEGVEVSDSDGDLFEAKHHHKYKCERCDSVFTTRKSRLRHARETHVLERRFTCNLCQRSFFSKNQVRSHMRWHSAERPYKCSSCSLSFQVKASLIGHQRVHTRECVYQCHICGIMFLHANGLRRHLRYHSQVKQFECDVCKRTFFLKSTLTKHIVKNHSRSYDLDKG
ncbi:zinc finger protein 12 isoform X2 [Anabrus simplex]|uniref:zinc finger protein 12 isoform X2 n=1 Tax=Anabrus simplex TaxID=316456 RepID=UPI0035A370E7